MATTHGKKGIIYKWNGVAGDLSDEPCTVTGNDAQITDSAKRILNPNVTVTFNPTNSVILIGIDYANGVAHFSNAPGTTTCSGTGAYIPTGNLVKTGYLYEWALSIDLEVSEYNSFQSDWKNFMAGHASANGSAKGWFVGTNWWDDFEDNVDGTMDFFFLQLFTYDPDDDRTGDHFDCWVTFSGFELPVGMTGPVSETVSFQVLGYPPFTPNA